jgi:hypothetical protein
MEIDGVFEVGLPVSDAPSVRGHDEHLAASFAKIGDIPLGHARQLNRRVVLLRVSDNCAVTFDLVGWRRGKKLDGLPSGLDKGLEDTEGAVASGKSESHGVQPAFLD